MTLYIVATPIGNLGDMTYRGVEVLGDVDFLICEDTRHTKILLERYNLDKPRVSYHAQSHEGMAEKYLDRIQKGETAAYVSDAGTPCVSDPGYRLVKLAHERGIHVVPLPGASAVTTLVSACGVGANSFTFHGFVPHKKGRQTMIQSFAEADRAQVVYESVHRFHKLLKELDQWVGGDRMIVVGRELTKMHEEIFRGTVREAMEHFGDENTKGEFVVLITKK